MAVTSLAILSVAVRSGTVFALDLRLARAVQNLASPYLDLAMSAVSYPGNSPQSFVLVGLIVLGLFAVGHRWEAISALLAGAGSAGLNTVAKAIVQRPRPAIELVHVTVPLGDFSLPSGHVVFYTAFFGFILYVAWTMVRQRALRTLVCGVSAGLVILVGVSRPYLGAHWPSDVLAGYLLGSLWLALAIRVHRRGTSRTCCRPGKRCPVVV